VTKLRTHRLLLDVVERVVRRVHDLSLNLIRPSAIVPQAAGAGANIALCKRQRLAVVQRLDGGELQQVALKQVRELDQHAAAVARADLAPGALKGVARGLDGEVDIFLGCFLDRADDGLIGRVDDLEALALDALDELVVDEAVACPVRLGWLDGWRSTLQSCWLFILACGGGFNLDRHHFGVNWIWMAKMKKI
jgi:hypothetical protein